jgi:hypothetical protein
MSFGGHAITVRGWLGWVNTGEDWWRQVRMAGALPTLIPLLWW